MNRNFHLGQIVYMFEINYHDFSYTINQFRIKDITENRPDDHRFSRYSLEILKNDMYVNTKIDTFVGCWLFDSLGKCEKSLRDYLMDHLNCAKRELQDEQPMRDSKKVIKQLKKSIESIEIQ